MNIGIDSMSFYRISLSSLEEVKKSIDQKSISPDARKTALLFVDQLKKGDINGDGTITNYEYDQFIRSKGRSSKDEWLLKLIDEKGEKLKAKPLPPSVLGPYLYEKAGVKGLTEDYQEKYDKVLESGLKIYLKDSDSSGKAMSKIDLAYKRLLAIEESKKTGIPIVVVLDYFLDPLHAHGNQIAKRDIEKQGLIPLNYDLGEDVPSLELINEVVDLKKKGVNIQSFNLSVKQPGVLTVTQLKEVLEKDGIVEVGEIKDDGSNLVNYKSQIRDWLLNGKGGVYGPVMPGLDQLKLGHVRERITAFDKLAANSINFVNSAGNDGPGTISIYSFVQGGTPVGALNSSGKVTNYTSETSLVRNHAVVRGNHIAMYEQGSGKIRHDYDGDTVYDEELPLGDGTVQRQKILFKLDTLKIADEKVVQKLRAIVAKLCTNNTENNAVPFNNFIEGYVFKKEDLELIKKDIESIKQKNNHNPTISKYFTGEINTAQKKFSGDLSLFMGSDNFHYLDHFNQILVNPDNGKLQFIYKSPIEGTSFAAPQIAVAKAHQSPLAD
jgi:hypothetical protein